jgi:hypothetical protein
MTTVGQEAPVWVEEEFYFGNGCTPSWVTYRRSGERVQVREEQSLRLEPTDDPSSYAANLGGKAEFFVKYSDCQLLVMKGRQNEDGGWSPPSLYLIGWRELTDKVDFEQYERDKRDAWKKPVSS